MSSCHEKLLSDASLYTLTSHNLRCVQTQETDVEELQALLDNFQGHTLGVLPQSRGGIRVSHHEDQRPWYVKTGFRRTRVLCNLSLLHQLQWTLRSSATSASCYHGNSAVGLCVRMPSRALMMWRNDKLYVHYFFICFD